MAQLSICSMQSPSKFQWHFSCDRILKFICNHKSSQIAKSILRKKATMLLYLTSNYTIEPQKWKQHDMGIKTYQWNSIEELDLNPCSYSHLIFDKGAQNLCWGKDSLFNKWCWENWISVCRRLKLFLCLSSFTISINSKWTIGLTVRHEILKLPQDRIRKTLDHISIGNSFLNRLHSSAIKIGDQQMGLHEREQDGG
jgi:hypothetical protein